MSSALDLAQRAQSSAAAARARSVRIEHAWVDGQATLDEVQNGVRLAVGLEHRAFKLGQRLGADERAELRLRRQGAAIDASGLRSQDTATEEFLRSLFGDECADCPATPGPSGRCEPCDAELGEGA